MPSPKRPPLAVVGLGALFPGSTEVHGFWRDVLAGTDLITDVPATHWLIDDYYDSDPKAPDRTYSKRGAFVPDVPFDPIQFGIPPTALPATDTAQLLSLVVAQQVLDDVARSGEMGATRERTSVILGMTGATELVVHMGARLQRPIWAKALRESGMSDAEVTAACDRIASHYTPWQESTFPGLLGNVVAGRIANRFDLGGTNCVVDAACASSLSALAMGAMELYTGSSDLVITGGADALNDVLMYMCFSKTPALSMTDDCRPFSDRADGTMMGEGFGMVALRRLEDAERDGDRIYAVVRGVGSSSDGRSRSVYAPRPEGQARAYRNAYEAAGYSPSTVELVEAHGTATVAGDAAEFASLRDAFQTDERDDTQWCALGSIKSQIGHTKSAAGVAGLIKTILALHHRTLPPTIKVDQPNPRLEIENSPFYLNTRARPWIRGAEHPRRAGVSAFGFGGSNFHVTLEEYDGAAPKPGRVPAFATHLLLFSGANAEAVLDRLAIAVSRASDGAALFDLSRESFGDFAADEAVRLAVLAADGEALRDVAGRVRSGVERNPAAALTLPGSAFYRTGQVEGGVALVFPGQGSQYVGMGGDLAMAFSDARAVWDRCANLGLDPVVFPPPRFDDASEKVDESRLRATEWAQPAIMATSLSQLALLRRVGLEPKAVAGHSLGELTALVAAGSIAPGQALRIARHRGQAMRDASATEGGMAAVTADAVTVQRTLDRAGVQITLANHNSPRQTVVSGDLTSLDAAESALQAAGLEVRRLSVATAFHSPLVADAAAAFGEVIADVEFQAPQLPLHGNQDGEPYPSEGDAIRQRLIEQIGSPVRWIDQVKAMVDAGIRTFVEVGPGGALSNLIRACVADRADAETIETVALDARGRDGNTALLTALARLAAAGHPLNVAALFDEYDAEQVQEPRKLSPATVMLNGANYGKPYPQNGVAEVSQQPAGPQSQPQPAQPAAAAPTAPPSPPVAYPVQQDAGWYAAFHAFQQSMADAHMAYLRAAEASWAALQGAQPSLPAANYAMRPAAPAAYVAPPAPVMPPAPAYAPPSYAPPQGYAAPQPTYAPPQPAYAPQPQPAYAPPPAQPAAPAPSAPAAAALTPAPTAAPARTAAPAPAAPQPAAPAEPLDVQGLLLSVVAEKTGYPVEMLDLQMDMESDLGIDSIKRVEILGALQERVEDMPPVEPDEMARLRTLADIIGYVERVSAPVATAPGNG